MKIAKGGFSWIFSIGIITIFFLFLSFFSTDILKILFLLLFPLSLLITILLFIFFRDPYRIIGKGIVAVADGKIREISKIDDNEIGKCIKISTFMNIHNVHVNRMPIDGKIIKITKIGGSYIPAYKKESENNERVIMVVESKIGLIKIVQIAGTIARRIVTYINEKNFIKKGERIGLIRLGSRVDVYIPEAKVKSITIKLKEKIKAGEDTIAEIND